MLPALVPDDSADYDMWVRTLVAYKKCVRFLRYMPTEDEVLMGDDGWREQICAHASEFQVAADDFTSFLIKVCPSKDAVITNYIHIIRAGHLKEMMEMHGYLSYLANDGVEAINGTLSVVYHRHSQHGGSQGQDEEHGGKTGGHTDGIERFALAHLAYATESAEVAHAEHKAKAAERAKRPHLTLADNRGNRAGSRNDPEKAARKVAKLPALSQ